MLLDGEGRRRGNSPTPSTPSRPVPLRGTHIARCEKIGLCRGGAWSGSVSCSSVGAGRGEMEEAWVRTYFPPCLALRPRVCQGREEPSQFCCSCVCCMAWFGSWGQRWFTSVHGRGRHCKGPASQFRALCGVQRRCEARTRTAYLVQELAGLVGERARGSPSLTTTTRLGGPRTRFVSTASWGVADRL